MNPAIMAAMTCATMTANRRRREAEEADKKKKEAAEKNKKTLDKK